MMKQWIGFCSLLAAITESGWTQTTVHCPDGDHIQIDASQTAIKSLCPDDEPHLGVIIIGSEK
jgi:hypothetical protein